MLFLKEDNIIYNNIVYYIDIFITIILSLQDYEFLIVVHHLKIYTCTYIISFIRYLYFSKIIKSIEI